LPRPVALPASLYSFLERAPAVPTAVPVAAVAPVVVKPVPIAAAPLTPTSQSSAPSLPPNSTPATNGSSGGSSSSVYDTMSEIEVQNVANNVKTTVLDVLKISDNSTENISRATSLLKQLLTKLNEQQVSLTASVNSAKKFGEDASSNLDSGTFNA
jgi:hypothetical protein